MRDLYSVRLECHKNGVRLVWVDSSGYFGNIDIINKDPVQIFTETMGREFVERVFTFLLDHAEFKE